MENTNNLLTIFVAIAALALVAQAAALFALFAAVRRTAARMDGIVAEVREQALPALEAAKTMLVESRQNVITTADNLAVASASLRTHVDRLGATLNDALDRTRLQVIRADEMASRTMDRVEETAEVLQHAVTTPVRKTAGLMAGLVAGVSTFFRGNRQREQQVNVPQDELFI